MSPNQKPPQHALIISTYLEMILRDVVDIPNSHAVAVAAGSHCLVGAGSPVVVAVAVAVVVVEKVAEEHHLVQETLTPVDHLLYWSLAVSTLAEGPVVVVVLLVVAAVVVDFDWAVHHSTLVVLGDAAAAAVVDAEDDKEHHHRLEEVPVAGIVVAVDQAEEVLRVAWVRLVDRDDLQEVVVGDHREEEHQLHSVEFLPEVVAVFRPFLAVHGAEERDSVGHRAAYVVVADQVALVDPVAAVVGQASEERCIHLAVVLDVVVPGDVVAC